METELTKQMKRGVVFFKPRMPTQMRTIRYAYEVWTPTRIVDAIRFEDFIERDESFCRIIDYKRFGESYNKTLKTFLRGRDLGKCKIDGEIYPNENCEGCVWKTSSHIIGMCITCYECKITVSDFKSKNGHNFHGNFNYYVVPKEIVKNIEPLVPEGIGIISYNKKSGTYRTYKESEFRNIPEETKTRLLYDAFKKWVDARGKI